MIFIADHGDIVVEKWIDPFTGMDALSLLNIRDLIKTYPALKGDSGSDWGVKGIIQTPYSPILITSYPILTSLFEGPARGRMILVRQITPGYLGVLSEQAGVEISMVPLSSAIPELNSDRNAFIESSSSTLIQPEGDMIAGYAILRDLNNQPALALKILRDREIHRQGQASLLYFQIASLVSGLIFSLVILLNLEKQILSPLIVIHTRIKEIGQSQNLALRIQVDQKNELGQLAGEINRTIEALEKSRAALLENERRLEFDATHDALTGLPNRTYFLNKVAEEITSAGDVGRHPIAVLFIDLDRFKLVNDSYNHLIGDQMLTQISKRLAASISETALLARLGGDEFAVLLCGPDAKAKAVETARSLQASLQAPLRVNGTSMYVSASIGIAATPGAATAEDLLRNADLAMYRAKASGRNRIELFNPEMHIRSMHTLNLDHDLHSALQYHELELFYQPIVNLKTNEITEVEALIRWRHPQLGLLTPDKFLPQAEETGYIAQLTRWILDSACQQLAYWRGQGLTNLKMSVNLSGRQLHDPDLAEKIHKATLQAGCPPESLVLEICEEYALSDFDSTLALLRQLADAGFQHSIDDFGTGYSSLTYLMRFPAANLKIDRTFIQGLPAKPDSNAIVASIITLGHNLNMEIIAEGVETLDQLEFLRSQGCDKAQGYLYSRPLPASELQAILPIPREKAGL